MTYLYRYSRWDGSRAPTDGDAEAALGAITDSVLSNGDVDAALTDLVRHGWPASGGGDGGGFNGLQGLLAQVRRARDQAARPMGSLSLDEVRRRVEEVLALERSGLERRLRDARARGVEVPARGDLGSMTESLLRRLEADVARDTAVIESLSSHPGEAVARLLSYEFSDGEARSRFASLKEALRRPSREAGLRNAARHLRADVAGARGGIGSAASDLSAALGGDASALARAIATWGDRLGPVPPSSPEELALRLRAEIGRVAEALRSLSDQTRAEVQAAVDEVLSDETLRRQVEDLASRMERLVGATDSPAEGLALWATPWDEGLDDALADLHRECGLDALERRLAQGIEQGSADGVDPALAESALGPEAREDIETLHDLARRLAEAGYIRREGDRFHLTPHGARRIGEQALREVFANAGRGRTGAHRSNHAGRGGDETYETKSYEFGDTFAVDVRESLTEAVMRRPGVPVRLRPDDFRVRRTETRTRAATVIALDLSKSMAENGHFVPAKKVALALESLVRSRFANDELYIIGFSTYARRIAQDDLPALTWDQFDPYTNIQHALSEARVLLNRRGDGLRQVILITDGEPTAHFEEGRAVHKFPTSPRTLRATMVEAKRCAGAGIALNVFMLGTKGGAFVTALGEVARGRVFVVDPSRLGEYVLVDFLRRRQEMAA